MLGLHMLVHPSFHLTRGMDINHHAMAVLGEPDETDQLIG